MKQMILTVLGVVGSAITSFFGGWDKGLSTLIIFMAIDYISGLIVDDVIAGGNFGLLPKLIVILLAVTAIRGILRYFYQVVFETCSQKKLFAHGTA